MLCIHSTFYVHIIKPGMPAESWCILGFLNVHDVGVRACVLACMCWLALLSSSTRVGCNVYCFADGASLAKNLLLNSLK